jgi:hypothetical protein
MSVFLYVEKDANPINQGLLKNLLYTADSTTYETRMSACVYRCYPQLSVVGIAKNTFTLLSLVSRKSLVADH